MHSIRPNKIYRWFVRFCRFGQLIGLFAMLMLVRCGGTPTEPADRSHIVDEGWLDWEEEIPASTGATFYLDPEAGDLDNPGTRAAPLPSLQAVVDADLIQRSVTTEYPWVDGTELVIANPEAPIRPGDTIVLLSGNHGPVHIRASHADGWVTIRADDGARPVLDRLELEAIERYRVQGLTIRGTRNEDASTLLHIESHGWHGPCRYVIVENCELASIEDASAWSAADWDQLAASGIGASGDYISIRDNTLINVDNGISAVGRYAIIERNRIENFCGDGLRGIGNDMVFEYNTVQNCYDVNDNHDDGFQSWSINDDPPRERIVLRGNIMINYTDPAQPFRGTLQGIGCFDGPYIDWVIENNVVITDHWHGITMLGAVNCRIVNNTVADLNEQEPGPPWICIDDNKDGTPSSGCLIRNNIARIILFGEGVVVDHNLESTDYINLFVDYSGFNLHALPGSPLIDAGVGDQAPAIDIEGTTRPQGAAVDIGAYER